MVNNTRSGSQVRKLSPKDEKANKGKKGLPKVVTENPKTNASKTTKTTKTIVTPVKPHTPTPGRSQTPTPEKPQNPTPVKPQTLTPVKPQTPTPVKPQTPTPVKPQTPTPKKKTKREDTNISKIINNYFEEDDTTEYEEEDSDVEDGKKVQSKSKQEAFDIINDSKVINMKNDLLALCEAPEEGRKRPLVVDRAMRAISYLKTLQMKSTRIPSIICKEMTKTTEVVIQALMELEARVVYAEAKAEVLENTRIDSGNAKATQITEPNNPKQGKN